MKSSLQTDASPLKYLDTSSLSGLESMRFATKHPIDGTYTGRHIARRQGGAGQYFDSREYAPGDDLRRLDWPAMGRTGRAYVRLYQDETNLSCTMLVDASGSMHFGGHSQSDELGSKIEWCKYFCTALSHMISLGRDQVGLMIAAAPEQNTGTPSMITNQPERFTPPSGAPRDVRALQQRLSEIRATGATGLVESLEEAFLRLRRRGVLLVVSDFLVRPFDEVLRNLRSFRVRGWETIAVHVVHPDEETLPDGIAFRFSGMEGEGAINCRPSEVRKVYQEQFSRHCGLVRDGLVAAGVDYHRFSTSTSYLDAVRHFLVPRRG